LSAADIDDSTSSAMKSSGCAKVASGRRTTSSVRPAAMIADT